MQANIHLILANLAIIAPDIHNHQPNQRSDEILAFVGVQYGGGGAANGDRVLYQVVALCDQH